MKYLENTMILLLSSGLPVMALPFGTCGPVSRMLETEGRIYQKTMVYIQTLAGGSLLQFFATGSAPLIRSYDGVVTAMISIIVGSVISIMLDCLFVVAYHYGVVGAIAVAVIG